MKNTAMLIFILVLIIGCKSPEARKPISKKSGSFIEESAERNIALNKKEHKIIEKLIEKDTANHYIASENGFWYAYHNKIDIDTIDVEFGDLLNFDYYIEDLNGNSIYKENELRTREYAMDQEELFSGLREGLKLMNPGETVVFLFPSQKAYGYYGDNKKIGINVPIKTIVTLNSITKNESD